jgi:hypothetical protein
MLISRTKSFQRDRGDIDDKAKRLILEAYREGCRTRSQMPFDAALNTYCCRYPHISRELAGHTVAYTLATAGV